MPLLKVRYFFKKQKSAESEIAMAEIILKKFSVFDFYKSRCESFAVDIIDDRTSSKTLFNDRLKTQKTNTYVSE